jgi:hypothetical protein
MNRCIGSTSTDESIMTATPIGLMMIGERLLVVSLAFCFGTSSLLLSFLLRENDVVVGSL